MRNIKVQKKVQRVPEDEESDLEDLLEWEILENDNEEERLMMGAEAGRRILVQYVVIASHFFFFRVVSFTVSISMLPLYLVTRDAIYERPFTCCVTRSEHA